MKGLATFLLAAIAVAAPNAQQAPAPQRVGLALVIGNSRYSQAELPTVDLDRSRMTAALRSLNFRVREAENLQRPRDFEEELRTFLKSENASPEDMLVVYYSGHGLQMEGKTYLLGTGMTTGPDLTASLREYSADVENIVRIMEQAAPAARVLIIDACRNNPFVTTARKTGVAFQRGIEDTFIIFADEPGKTVPARSEASIQSPFTAGLLFAFENSDAGLEERFQIARTKTRELNPDQNPQLYKSDPSANRNLAFVDHGGKSTTRSAELLLDDVEPLYRAGAWGDFREKISSARVLSSEPALRARLDKEFAFSGFVMSAMNAERAAGGANWAVAAAAWQQAAGLFPARGWVLERSALAWLMTDQLKEAADALARLTALETSEASKRAGAILADLVRFDPSLQAIVAASPPATGARSVVEFEKFGQRPASQ